MLSAATWPQHSALILHYHARWELEVCINHSNTPVRGKVKPETLLVQQSKIGVLKFLSSKSIISSSEMLP